MNNGLAVRPTVEVYHEPPRRYSFDELANMADAVARSGLFKMNAPQALTLMMLSESLGLHPIQAMMRYHIFEGRPTMRSDAMLAEFQRQGGRIEWTKDTPTECEAILYHDQHCPKGKAVSFTMADAKAAGLAGKQVWQAHPRPTLTARVITTGIQHGNARRDHGHLHARRGRGVRTTRDNPTTPPGAIKTRESPAGGRDGCGASEHYRATRNASGPKRVNPKPPRASRDREGGKWIAEAVEDFNAELAKVAESQLRKRGIGGRPSSGQQVINAVQYPSHQRRPDRRGRMLNSKGKRDGEAMARGWASYGTTKSNSCPPPPAITWPTR